MRFGAIISLSLTVFVAACSESMDDSDALNPVTPSMARSTFEMSARILGPVQNDDDADLRIELKETNGVAARVNFFRLTCNNGSQQQWGAGNITAERGSNQVQGNSELVIVRHYLCPSSGRPATLEADLIDSHGFPHRVKVAPFHPDWPGV